MKSSLSWRLLLGVPVSIAACELTEVTVPSGETVIVVQAVMRPDRVDQFVVVERSFTGAVDPGQFEIGDVPTEGQPRTPVEGAVVTVQNLDFTNALCGDTVVFTNRPQSPGLFRLPGVYWSPPSCPPMRPGDRLHMRVETPGGQVITGEARVPGLNGAELTVAGTTVAFDPNDTTTFNRDRDTLHLRVDAVAGRLVQLEVRRLVEAEEETRTIVLVDSTAFSLPGNSLDVFTRQDGDDVFRAGRHYAVTVALTDTNYFDYARSFNNRFTGRGFINHLLGGIGVFGSLAAVTTTVTVTGDVDDAREGVYRLEGQIEGIDIDVELNLFLARSIDQTDVSAFLNGDWIRRCDCGPEGGRAWIAREIQKQSIDGRFAGDTLFAIVNDPDAATKRYVLRGIRTQGAPFIVSVADSLGLGSYSLGSLTATQR